MALIRSILCDLHRSRCCSGLTWWCHHCVPGKTSDCALWYCRPRPPQLRSTPPPSQRCSTGYSGTGGPGTRRPSPVWAGSPGRSGPTCSLIWQDTLSNTAALVQQMYDPMVINRCFEWLIQYCSVDEQSSSHIISYRLVQLEVSLISSSFKLLLKTLFPHIKLYIIWTTRWWNNQPNNTSWQINMYLYCENVSCIQLKFFLL